MLSFRVFIPQHNGDLEQNVLYQKEGWRGFPSSLSFANQIGASTDSYMIKDHITKLIDAKAKAGKSDLWDSWMVRINFFYGEGGEEDKWS